MKPCKLFKTNLNQADYVNNISTKEYCIGKLFCQDVLHRALILKLLYLFIRINIIRIKYVLMNFSNSVKYKIYMKDLEISFILF